LSVTQALLLLTAEVKLRNYPVLFSDVAEVKGRAVDPFFGKISQTMKQIEIIIQDRGRMLSVLFVL